MNIDKQIEIMEKQLESFNGPFEKMAYMTDFFDPDPEFTQEARDIVRANLCKNLGGVRYEENKTG